MYSCAECTLDGCMQRDIAKTPKNCPCRENELQNKAGTMYKETENHSIAYNAATVEAEGYGRLCRMEEIMVFAKKAGYQKIGLVFCMGLKNEAKTASKILRHNGFEVVSVGCKNGGVTKATIGLSNEQTLSGCNLEVMCNPIAQALLMNKAEVQLNILLGLCVGHDTLALKHLDAPTTVLAVKDRVSGHNPLAPIYVANTYYKKRFFK